nr:hypothetical protein Iba_chr08bCG4470 [Ipomoea batatas]
MKLTTNKNTIISPACHHLTSSNARQPKTGREGRWMVAGEVLAGRLSDDLLSGQTYCSRYVAPPTRGSGYDPLDPLSVTLAELAEGGLADLTSWALFGSFGTNLELCGNGSRNG